MSISIDLNADLGEHKDSSLDELILPFLSSCNIACGGHAGDETSIKRTIDLAIKNKVAIGAHPSFPDREKFGREVMDMEPQQLMDSLWDQINLVKRLVAERGEVLHHVKPHGALYNLAGVDEMTSKLIFEVIKKIDPTLKLYGLANSITEKLSASNKIRFVAESFADRKYEDDGNLKSRKKEGAVLEEKEVLVQVENLVLKNKVFAATEWIEIRSQTICLHSDTPGSVTLARRIHEHLTNKGAKIIAV